MAMKIVFSKAELEAEFQFWGDLLAICSTGTGTWSTEIITKLTNMAQKSDDHRQTMDRRWSSEDHFLSKLYNKLLHRPTKMMLLIFVAEGGLSVLVLLGGSGQGNERTTNRAFELFNFRENLH